MNESTRGYKVVIGALLGALAIVSTIALTRKGGDEDSSVKLNQLASRLEECNSSRLDYKTKFEDASAQLKKLQEQAAAGNVLGTEPVTVTLRTSSGGPGLPPDQVTKVISQNKGGLKQCYERALKRDTGLQLQPINVTFRFNIAPTGSAGGTSLKSDTHIDQQLVECFKQAVARWKFPPFAGDPIPIELPVPFQPIGGTSQR